MILILAMMITLSCPGERIVIDNKVQHVEATVRNNIVHKCKITNKETGWWYKTKITGDKEICESSDGRKWVIDIKKVSKSKRSTISGNHTPGKTVRIN